MRLPGHSPAPLKTATNNVVGIHHPAPSFILLESLSYYTRTIARMQDSTKQMLIHTYFQGFVRDQFTFGIHRAHGDTEDRKVLLTIISNKQMIIPTYFQCFVRDQFTFGTHPALGDTEFKSSSKSHHYQTDVDTNLF